MKARSKSKKGGQILPATTEGSKEYNRKRMEEHLYQVFSGNNNVIEAELRKRKAIPINQVVEMFEYLSLQIEFLNARLKDKLAKDTEFINLTEGFKNKSNEVTLGRLSGRNSTKAKAANIKLIVETILGRLLKSGDMPEGGYKKAGIQSAVQKHWPELPKKSKLKCPKEDTLYNIQRDFLNQRKKG